MNNYVKVSLPVKQTDKQMATSSATQSGTGVFYQAMPAVGADGKNIMKLIPVQRVNGQFVRMQTNPNLPSSYRKAADFEPQRLFAHPIHLSPNTVSTKVPVLQPALSGRYILKRPPDVNVMLNPVTGPGKCHERVTVAAPIRVQVPIVATKVSQNVPVAPPVLNCGKTLTLLEKKQWPVTVKSPVLPNGHYLQIPPNAQVKTLPASALPQAIKKRILTPPVSATSASSSTTNLPTVVYVSPVNTMKLGPSSKPPAVSPAVPPAPTSLNRLPKPPCQSLLGPATSSMQPSKSVPKETRNPVTPIKWVVQERSDSAAPCLVPQNSSTMTSEILKTLAQMERVNQMEQSTAQKQRFLPAGPAGVGPGKDNALVMCDGKLYFVGKRTPEFSDRSPEMQKTSGTVNSPSKHTIVNDNINQRSKPPLPSLPTSSFQGPPTVKSPRQGTGHIVISDGPDEIIDLCDDDPPNASVSRVQISAPLPQPESSQSAPDEDEDSNVIFVSYIPPKSSESAGDEGEINQESQVVQEKPVEDETVLEKENGQEKAANREQDTSRENVSAGENLCKQNVESSQRQENTTENESVLIVQDNSMKDIVDPDSDRCIAASEPKSRLELDCQLKLKFQITSDVKICLQRISSESSEIPKKGPSFGSVNKRTLDGIRRLMQGSRVESKKKSVETRVSSANEQGECSPWDPKRKKVEVCGNSDTVPDLESICRPSDPGNCTSLESTLSPCEVISITGSLTSAAPLEKPELENIVMQQSTTSGIPEVMAAVVPSITQESGSAIKSKKPRNVPKAKTSQTRSRKGKGKGKQCRGVPETVLEKDASEKDLMETSSGPVEEGHPSEQQIEKEGGEATSLVELYPDIAMQEGLDDVPEYEVEPTSVEICCPSTLSELSCNGTGEPPGGDLFTAAPMDPEEIKRHEKIKRLKELLKEKEAALEVIRKNLI